MHEFYRRMEIETENMGSVAFERQLHVAVFVVVRVLFEGIVVDQEIDERNSRIQLPVFLEVLEKYRDF